MILCLEESSVWLDASSALPALLWCGIHFLSHWYHPCHNAHQKYDSVSVKGGAVVELISCISFFLSASWKFFTQVQVPGMGGITFAALFVGLFLAVLSLRLLAYMFGFGSISSNTISSFHNAGGKGDKK